MDYSLYKSAGDVPDLKDGIANVKLRIEKVSSSHDQQLFVLRISPRDAASDVLYTCSLPILVKSKKPDNEKVPMKALSHESLTML